MEVDCSYEYYETTSDLILPDQVLFEIFKYLPAKDLLNAGETCSRWCDVSYNEVLWKRLFYKDFKIKKSIPIAAEKTSWYDEYKRLTYNVPTVCSEILFKHENEVLHVSYSHDGTMFATSSKDGFIVVWTAGFPTAIKYSLDMKSFNWKYTQFSQFNQTDTLLLVSGVHFGVQGSTSGEIAVFSLQGGFTLQCRVGNKPYDIFGTWYSDQYLLSGDIQWLGSLISATALWINKASQETASELTPILNQLFRFLNSNASSVRGIMVADPVSVARKVVKVAKATSFVPKKDHESHLSTGCGNEEVNACDDDECNDDDLSCQPEKILIFTKGSKAYTPHQIGFKKIKNVNFPKVIDRGPSLKEILYRRRQGVASPSDMQDDPDAMNFRTSTKYDDIDHCIDLHGHIVGMCLSPDHRYLYVNSRPWPEGYVISSPLDPPPIAQEIDIHVIDLSTFQSTGSILRSHRGYSPNNECFFIFLDVTDEYVASGAEDKHAYLWDRHYEVVIGKVPHSDVVNSVAFNPINPEILVTTSDDYSVKVWRSKHLTSTLNEPLPRVYLENKPASSCLKQHLITY